MLTINAEIKKDGLRSDGTYNVKLRFTLDRKMRRLATSLFVTSKDLTKELKIKQNSPIKKEIDSLIRSYQEKCAKLQVELNHYTIDEVMDYLDGEHQKQQTIDFIKFSREWIASTTIKGAPNYTTSTVWDKETETLTYDNNKHLIKISGDKTCMWSWGNDNISKFSYYDGRETITCTCTYYADKENKHSIIDINALRLYHICGIEYADLLLMAHPNLLGTTNKNLLKSVTSSDGWTENYSYEIDKEGYPTKIIVTETNEYGSSYNDTYTLIWQ